MLHLNSTHSVSSGSFASSRTRLCRYSTDRIAIMSSSRLCLDFFTSFHLYSFAMRGSSLKSPSQNRTCPIKAYGSSISLSPNKHLLHISSEFPMDVSLKSPDTFSMSANKTGLCDVYSSRVPASHTHNIL